MGQPYGFRVHGSYLPEEGDRFNPNKLLVDPYARAFGSVTRHHSTMAGGGDISRDEMDSGDHVSRCILVDEELTGRSIDIQRRPWRIRSFTSFM